MRKIYLFLLFSIFCTFIVKSAQEHSVLHLKQINEQDTHATAYKQRLIDYYESNEYIKEVNKITTKALSHILKLNKPINAAVIFDIDETSLTEYFFYKGKKFKWKNEEAIDYRLKGTNIAIEPVLAFYKALLKKGYKIIFITARRETTREATIKNLNNAGYKKYSELIMLPMDLLGKIDHDKWKAQVREELSKKYNIVASISDNQKDLEGGNVGYTIKLPNFLY